MAKKGNKLEGLTCYACEQDATSQDHVPPRCLFPEQKDLNDDFPGLNLRKELIKVRSCPVHNEQASKDDEYIIYLVATSIVNNRVGTHHFATKVLRALMRSPGFTAAFLEGHQKVVLHDGQETCALSNDWPRFASTMQKIARGLYYATFEQKWLVELMVLAPHTSNGDETGAVVLNAPENQALLALMDCLWAHQRPDILGANPEVFQFSFATILGSTPPWRVLKMVFFEGFTVYVRPMAEAVFVEKKR